jgi:hypothetical protein
VGSMSEGPVHDTFQEPANVSLAAFECLQELWLLLSDHGEND